MAKINQALLDRLKQKLGLSQPRVYAIIDQKVRESHLPRHLAAIAVASERGVSISRFASEDDLAAIRQAATSAAPRPVVVPEQLDTSRQKAKRQATRSTQTKRRGTSVFVVHGRHEKARREVFEFLRSLSLQPLEWTQIIRKTRQASPYVGTILDTAFRDAAAVLVILTPDDEAKLRPVFHKPSDPDYEKKLTGQARPNVLFEAGMAFGRNPDSTVLVQLGELRPFSDIAGRHVVHLSNDPTSRQELATKLANAGCNVDTTGTDWLDAGDLSL